MPKITFMPGARTVTVPAGTPLLEAARLAGAPAETPCGGKGTCQKCLVRVTDTVDGGAPLGANMPGWVLLCQARVGNAAVTVTFMSSIDIGPGQLSDCPSDLPAVDPALLPDRVEFMAKTIPITVEEPRYGDGLSDADRLEASVKKALGCRQLCIPLPVLRELPDRIRPAGPVMLSYTLDGEAATVVKLDRGDAPLALAVDIGTTTVAAALVGGDGAILGSKSGYNAQMACGLDVISRIDYAKTPSRREELRAKCLETVNALIEALCGGYGADPSRIGNICIAANTVMAHLLLGIVPEYIRLAPYTPAVYRVPPYSAGELGLTAHPSAPVQIAPSVGSYVGGDIIAGLLCTPLAAGTDELCLYIDIGTNGEIVLGNNDFIMACACSAGPAFEGGGIKYGMRAAPGAVEQVRIHPSGACQLTVIGDAPPAGICGSGMISLVSELFSNGLIDPMGKLINGGRFNLTACADGAELFVDNADIQNIIRAKAAIFSACRTLLRSVGLNFSDLARCYVAGGFGRVLNLADGLAIGMLPDLKHIAFLGNAALSGAYMALCSPEHRRRLVALAVKATYIDLSGEPSYMDEYTAALFLPHTDPGLFTRQV